MVTPDDAPRLHDHIDIEIKNGPWLRYNDPRRFGSFNFAPNPCSEHWLLKNLKPELSNDFSGDYLFATSRKRKLAVKNHIMDGKVVVGVGNIYAAESLLRAGIRPSTPARKVSRVAYQFLAAAIRDILANAINVGGTTLRDFVGSDGQPGYFKQSLNVYGRQGEDCRICGSPLKLQILGSAVRFIAPSVRGFLAGNALSANLAQRRYHGWVDKLRAIAAAPISLEPGKITSNPRCRQKTRLRI